MGYRRSRSRCRISTHHQTCKFRIREFCTKLTLVSALQQPRWNQRISRSWNQFFWTFRCIYHRPKDKDKSIHWCRQWSSIKKQFQVPFWNLFCTHGCQETSSKKQRTKNSENSSLQNPNKVNALQLLLWILLLYIYSISYSLYTAFHTKMSVRNNSHSHEI